MVFRFSRIRTRLFLQTAALVLSSTMLFAAAVVFFVLGPLTERLAEIELGLVAKNLASEIRFRFDTVERQLAVAKNAAEGGFLPAGRFDAFTNFFFPVLEAAPSVSAVIFAAEDSREFILFKDEAGWRARYTGAETLKAKARWRHWDAGKNFLKEEILPSLYDARTRPWHKGALELKDERQVFWTKPYVFYTKQEPGITASVRLRGKDGGTYVLGMDVSLRDLSALTSAAAVGKDGFLAVFDEENRILALPGGGEKKTGTDAKNILLQPPAAVKDDPLAEGFSRWIKADRVMNENLPYPAAGRKWIVRFIPFSLGANRFSIGTFSPAEEFDRFGRGLPAILAAILAASASLAALLAAAISRRLGDPIARLAAQSTRIGNLDFTPLVVGKTPYEEINRLAEAQEKMRGLLRDAARNLEETVRLRTIELEKFSRAIDQSPVSVVITDTAGAIEYVNPAFCRTTGYAAEEVLGKNPRILKSGETPPELYVDLWKTILSGRDWYGEFVNKKKSGELYWESVVVAPVRNERGEASHFVAIKEDVSDLRKARRDLQDQLAFIGQLIDALPNPIFYKGADGRYLGCNRAYEQAFGTMREYIAGKTVLEVEKLPESDRIAYHENDLRLLRTGGTSYSQVKRTFADGTVHELLHWTLGFKLSDGKPGGILGIFVDVSELKDKENELRKARAAAEEATKAKSLFLANMSHEIRTPMNAVIGMAHLALKTGLTPRQRDYVEKIHKAGTALLGIINDILDFPKVEAGKLELECVDFDLDDVVSNVTNLLGKKASEKEIELLCRIPRDIPRGLKGDPLRLGQVLLNLLGNAVKFTERGGVFLEVRRAPGAEGEAALRFDVRDTGIGMTQEQTARLFRAFSQADDSTTRKYGGTGLGLAISKRLVDLMGGEIRAESEPGKGSVFSFTARFGLAEERKKAAKAAPAGLPVLPMLVADDNPEAREILVEYLASFEFPVDAVASGEEAVEAVLRGSGGRPYAAVFMDWKMPGMGGLEAAKRIKSGLEAAKPPAVVMVTAYEEEELRREAKDVSVDGFLVKPVSQSLLFETILGLFMPEAKDGIVRTAAEERSYGLEGTKVLLAEDNEINRQIAVELLESQGVSVEAAVDGREAVEKALAPEADYDVVLMDLQMPELDGLEAARLLRGKGFTLPIIAMTARAMAEERELCLRAGMDAHVAKPVEPALLFAAVARYAKKAPPRDPPGAPAPGAGGSGEGPDFPAVEGIDVRSGLLRAAGNKGLYRKLLLRFAEEHAAEGGTAAEALRAGRKEEALRTAHTLKGLAGSLGIAEAASAAAELEKDLRSDETAGGEAPAKAKRLEEALERAARNIQEALGGGEANRRPEAAPRRADPDETTRRALEKFANLLRAGDAEAADHFDRERETIASAFEPGTLERLENRLRSFLFDDVLEIVQAALKSLSQNSKQPGEKE